MDQFVLPEGVQPYITVPCECAEPWDGGDFMTYPERKGWSKDLANDALGGRTPAELDAFLQTWLFFGCAIEVLKAGGVRVSADDFIDRSNGTRTVTTKKLPSFIVKWRKLWPGKKDVSPKCRCSSYQVYNPERRCGADRCWQSVVRDRNGDALRLSQRILDEVRKFTNQICLHGTEVVDLSEKKRNIVLQHSVQPEIALSISALGFTLSTAMREIYDTPPGYEHWETPAFIKQRLLQANWCPSRVAEIFNVVGIDGRYYCAANPTREELDHSKCDERGCVARNVNEKVYVTRHTLDCQGCEHVEVPDNDLLPLIRSGEIPLITWIESEGRLTINKVPLGSTTKPEPSTLLDLPERDNDPESEEDTDEEDGLTRFPDSAISDDSEDTDQDEDADTDSAEEEDKDSDEGDDDDQDLTVQSDTYVAISHVWVFWPLCYPLTVTECITQMVRRPRKSVQQFSSNLPAISYPKDG